MNKAELIDAVASKTGASKTTTAEALDALMLRRWRSGARFPLRRLAGIKAGDAIVKIELGISQQFYVPPSKWSVISK